MWRKLRILGLTIALAAASTSAVVGSASPAYAVADDLAITVVATPQTLTLPTMITYTVTAMADPAGHTSLGGTLRMTFPATSIGMINAVDPLCRQTGARHIDCEFSGAIPGTAYTWYFQGNTVLLGTLNIAATATLIQSNTPDTDSSNDADTATCAVVLSLITSCT